MTPILELKDAEYRYRNGTVGVDGVSLSVTAGRNLGLVGESGAGKSTLIWLLLGLRPPTSGRLEFDGEPFAVRRRERMRAFRRSVQAVFQDPYSSLDPRQRVGAIVAEPLRSLRIAAGTDARGRVREALVSVGLPEDAADGYPHEFSGGQRQRIAIARAIVVRPRVLLADEAVSALDMTTRVQVVDLLGELSRSRGLSVVMVSHDLSVVAALCQDTVVLRDGRVVEAGETASVLGSPQHEYTRRLITAVPRLPNSAVP